MVSLWQGHGRHGPLRTSRRTASGGNECSQREQHHRCPPRAAARQCIIPRRSAGRFPHLASCNLVSRERRRRLTWHRGPHIISVSHSVEAAETRISVSLSLNVTSFWHRWGYGSDAPWSSGARNDLAGIKAIRSCWGCRWPPPPGRQAAVESSSSIFSHGAVALLRSG